VISQTVKQAIIRAGYQSSLIPTDPAFGRAADVERAWSYIVEKGKKSGGQKPVRLEDVLDALVAARFEGRELVFFMPWGPRYKTKEHTVDATSPEMATLTELREIFEQLVGFGYRPRVILMPADVYGTEINNLAPDFVERYFASLTTAAKVEFGEIVNLYVRPWSFLRGSNADLYEQLRQDFSERIGSDAELSKLMRNALRKARVMNPSEAEGSARRYVLERLIEAEIIGKLYKPIKLSVVRKENDELDGDSLPRIYVVANKAPWMIGDGGSLLRE
jgi:hypothetical protein